MTTAESSTQRGQYVHANGLRIYYEEYGSGAPLILLHGGTGTCGHWEPLIPALAEHFHILAVDSRGHGRTDNPSGKLSYRGMAEDVAAFAEALGVTRPLVYGFSDGAQIALELGMRYPNFAQALVVAGAFYYFSDIFIPQLSALGMEDPGVVNLDTFQRIAPGWAANMQEVHVCAGDPDYWKTLLRQISELWYAPLHYTAQELGQISAPTLILSGDRDEFIPVEQAVDMYRMIPNSELGIVPNGLHDAPLTTSGMQAMTLDFLVRHSH